MKGLELINVVALNDKIAELTRDLNIARENEATWRKKHAELVRVNKNLNRQIDQYEADKAMAERKKNADDQQV